ncbi:endonuclease III [Candidatus Dojkabacteria bacterium]|uniref:Endonuclease III n=1 Tax=Candidatus Dojkabacteria bacterium TaxID=2099670 RepID=A0A955HYU0_9BACT|nr:endonuclease III [Candidatus Dojkabacteria bacterium]
MNRKEKAQYILHEMEKLFPEAETELKNWENSFQFLVCIVLSAQTTDKQVNKVTKELFKKYPDARGLSQAKLSDVEKFISSINFFRNKAKYIISLAKDIDKKYKGNVPSSVSKLEELAGVGRKSAHVYLNHMYKSNKGIGVDTHIMRVSKRLGLTSEKTPEKIAQDLEKVYPRRDWYKVNSLFVLYGRYYCKARMTKSYCIFKEFCSYCFDK